MKKFFLTWVLIISIVPLSFGTSYLTPGQILKIIKRSSVLNPDIKNPGIIFPGQIIRYQIYEALPPIFFIAKNGDSQYKILSKYILSDSDILINDLAKESLTFNKNSFPELKKSKISLSGFMIGNEDKTIWIIIIVVVLLRVIVLFLKLSNKKEYPQKKNFRDDNDI